MRSPLPAALAVLALGPLGCTGNTDCDPAVEECDAGDTAADFDGDVELLQVDHGCCGPGEDRCSGLGEWWVDVVTEGRPAQVSFTLLEAGLPATLRWTETHDVPVLVEDPDGYWTNHALAVEVARTSDCTSLKDCEDRFSAGQTSLFACSPELAADGLQVKVQLLDAAGNELACEHDGLTSVDAPGCG